MQKQSDCSDWLVSFRPTAVVSLVSRDLAAYRHGTHILVREMGGTGRAMKKKTGTQFY